MYVLSTHFENPEQEIICPLTLESYVYVEVSEDKPLDEKYKEGALETLPRRFYQLPVALFNKGGGRIEVTMKKPYDY
jgi:hypothetical protein